MFGLTVRVQQMAEIPLPVIITAIANSEFEGFVAGTLYSQGWSIIYRGLDAQAIEDFISTNPDLAQSALLIYSPDLPGLKPQLLIKLTSSLRQIVGFSPDIKSNNDFPGLLNLPAHANELVSVVRGFVRAPMVRPISKASKRVRRAKVIGIGSTTSGAGSTTFAINLAMELSLLEKEVLLLDADVKRPSIAFLLALRNLHGEDKWLSIAQRLSVGELTRDQMTQLDSYMDSALSIFDFVIIDLGSIEKISDSLTDRRWTSTVIHWSCDSADELIFTGSADNLGSHRIGAIAKTLSPIKIPAKISVLLNYKSRGRKSTEQESLFLTSIAPLKPSRIFTLPKDCRGVDKAQKESTTLVDVNERGILRKAIAKIAVEVSA